MCLHTIHSLSRILTGRQGWPKAASRRSAVARGGGELACITWSISIALLTTKVVRSLTYTPLSTFSFSSSLSLGSCVVARGMANTRQERWKAPLGKIVISSADVWCPVFRSVFSKKNCVKITASTLTWDTSPQNITVVYSSTRG